MLVLRTELSEFIVAVQTRDLHDPATAVANIAKEGADVIYAIYTGLDSMNRETDVPQFKAEVAACIAQGSGALLVKAPRIAYSVTIFSGAIADALVDAAVDYTGPAEDFYKNAVVPRLEALRVCIDKAIAVGKGTV